jgi:competence protein ComEC
MKKIITLVIIIIFLFLATFAFAAEALKISFIDVGDGDAILIQTPNQNALIDTAGLLYGQKLSEYLKENNAVKLNYLIITHPHLDHMGGAFFIVPELAIGEIFDNGQDLDDNEDIYRWYKKLIRKRDNYRILKAGDSLSMDGASLEVLWPKQPNQHKSFNANSLVIMLNYKKFNCLLTGDFNQLGEKELLQEGLDLKANLLKVGHHGYFDATSSAFLDAVSPQIAIISVDAKNIRGAPSEVTLKQLNERKIKVYRTDKNGNIVVTVEKNGKFKVTTQR